MIVIRLHRYRNTREPHIQTTHAARHVSMYVWLVRITEEGTRRWHKKETAPSPHHPKPSPETPTSLPTQPALEQNNSHPHIPGTNAVAKKHQILHHPRRPSRKTIPALAFQEQMLFPLTPQFPPRQAIAGNSDIPTNPTSP